MNAPISTGGPAYARLPSVGLIVADGADARSFLHAQLTCDIASLTPGRCQHGGYCTAKGRLLATFLVWQREDAFFLRVPGGQQGVLHKQLSKFILRAKVKLRDASASHVCIGLSGEGAAHAVKRAVGVVCEAPYEVRQLAGVSVIKHPSDRHEIVVAVEQAQAIEAALSEEARALPVETWERLDMRSGTPVITAQTQEAFVPQMVNLDLIGGVSFTKGCYPGQEIVARTYYLGRLKQRMYLARIAADVAPEPGDRLYSARFGEQACGTVVRAVAVPEGGYEMLAVTQIEEARPGNVHWRAIDGPELQFLELPYSITTS